MNRAIIEKAWQSNAITEEAKLAVLETIDALDQGQIRVAEKKDGTWIVHEWVKIAILLYFRVMENRLIAIGDNKAFDKVPLKFSHWQEKDFQKAGFRVVPPAFVRKGSFIGKAAVLMPSYVNIGAYVDEGTMVDTWATVGSCAQIGKHVHLSGGVGIGGVLEPLQALLGLCAAASAAVAALHLLQHGLAPSGAALLAQLAWVVLAMGSGWALIRRHRETGLRARPRQSAVP